MSHTHPSLSRAGERLRMLGAGLLLSAGLASLSAQAADGDLLWSNTLSAGYTWSTPVVAANRVYVQDQSGGIEAFGVADGQQQWATTLATAYPVSSPVYRDGYLYALAGDTLYILNAATGSVTNQFSGASPLVNQAPTVTGSRVLVADTTALYALNSDTLATVWTAPTPGNVIADGTRFYALGDQLYALDPATGNELWRVASPDGSSFAQGAIDGDVLVAVTYGANIGAYQVSDSGAIQLWSADMSNGGWYWADSAPPAVADGMVYATSRAGVLYAFALNGDGTPVWQKTVRGEGTASALPSVVDGTVLVQVEGTADGGRQLMAFNGADGTALWSTAVDSMAIAWGSPTVADGVAYLATDHDGAVYAFDAGSLSGGWYMLKHNPAQTGSDNGWSPAAGGSGYAASGSVLARARYGYRGFEGVTVTVRDENGSTVATLTTDANGEFNAGDLANGTYTFRPSLRGYRFTPASRTVEIADGDLGDLNFLARRVRRR